MDKIYRKNPQWGSRDRRFIAESTFEIVRWWQLFLYHSGSGLEKEDVFHRVFAVYLVKLGTDVPDWLFSDQRSITEISHRLQLPLDFATRESIPYWLDDLGRSELGNTRWESEISAMNSQAKVFLRVNTLKTNVEKLQLTLREKQIETSIVTHLDTSLVLEKRQNLAHIEEYKNGLFEIQDLGSQAIAPFLRAKSGEKIIDACAGGGGKTLHLASLMNNKGEIWSLDVETKKLDNLKIRAKRAGLDIVKTALVDDHFVRTHEGFADKLLLDVPCSGLGVLKRSPDTKWKLTRESLEVTKNTQTKILDQYTRMLRSGGEMVYATCSILPSENRKQIDRFIEEQRGRYSFLEENNIWPSEGADGYYMARLRKNS